MFQPGEEEEGEDAVSVSKRRSDDDGDESANKRHSLSNDITSEAFPPLSSLSDSLWMPMMSLPALRPLAQETRAAAKERKSSPNGVMMLCCIDIYICMCILIEYIYIYIHTNIIICVFIYNTTT